MDLTYNKIRHIFLHDAENIAIGQKYKHRNVIILVENNPFRCDCDMYDFLRYLEGDMHPNVQNYFHIKAGDLRCHSPQDWNGVRLDDLSWRRYSRNLTCVVKNTGYFTACSDRCDCFLRPIDKAFIFDCSHKSLTSVPSDIEQPDISSLRTFTKSIDSISHIELNFSHNWLTHMPNLRTMRIGPVEKLTLSHNNISDISLDGLSTSMKVCNIIAFYQDNLKKKEKYKGLKIYIHTISQK